MLYSLLDQAGGISAQLAQFRVGDTVDLTTLAAKNGSSTLSVRKPDGSQVQLVSGEIRFTQTDQPGIYEVLALVPAKFAVNLAAAESKTAPLPVDELERLGLPMKSVEPPSALVVAKQETLHNAELEARQKLWRWLIVAALTVLLVETWLAGWVTRRSAARAEATA
jgi:hypothetical protein